MDMLRRAATLREQGKRAVLVTVLEVRGSTPRKPGSRMIVLDDGSIEGSIGGGRVEQEVTAQALSCLREETARVVVHKLTTELAMCCGGQMSFFLEPLMPDPTLIVLGCGHVGRALIYAAAPVGFRITAVDDREEFSTQELLPQAHDIVQSFDKEDIDALPFGPDAFVVIATRDHAVDQQLLEWCVNKPNRFLGVIGSPRKANMQRERLQAKGFAQEAIDAIHCPIGLDIGAHTPEEIAVSVCAELISIHRGGPRFTGRT